MTSNVIVQQINGGPIGVKNAIINGNFGINQRGVSGTVTLSAGAYGHDRWKAGASGCTYTFATSENVTTITISSGSLIQVVEDINLLTDTYTLSWQGTAQGKIGAGSFGNSGVTGSVTGGSNLNIEFGTGTVSKVQLERGTVATPFEFRSIGQELALCQRYYWQQGGGLFTRYGGGLVRAFSSTQAASMAIPPVPMRAFPSVSVLNIGSTTVGGLSLISLGTFNEEVSVNSPIVGPIRLSLTVSGGLSTNNVYEWESSNTRSTRVSYQAEL